MGKMKTKKIVRKRFKVTKTGKLLYRTQGKRHLRRKKSKARQRRQDANREMTTTRFVTMIKRFLYT